MPQPKNDPPSPEQSTGLGCFVRLVWLLLGNALMGLCLLFIARNKSIESLWSKFDWGYWITVAACLAVRYLDITRCHGRTAMDKPATLADWRHYALILLIAGVVLWAGAHAIGRM